MKKRIRQAKRSGAVGRLDRMLRYKSAQAAASQRARGSHVILNPAALKMSVGSIPGADLFDDELRVK